MSHPSPMPMLIEIAKKERDTAAGAMATAARALEAAQAQLSLLHGYRADYVSKQEQLLTQGTEAALARSYRQFIEKLDVAIAQQDAECQRLQARLNVAQAKLANTQRRVSSFQTLQERRASEQVAVERKQEQKQNDEVASQKAARSTTHWTNVRS